MHKDGKSVPTGTTSSESRPTHTHGLRATTARTAFQAQARTGSIAPHKHRSSKKAVGGKVGVETPISTNLETFSIASEPVQASTGMVGPGDSSAARISHDSVHVQTYTALPSSSVSRINNSSTANSHDRGGASRAAQEVARVNTTSTSHATDLQVHEQTMTTT